MILPQAFFAIGPHSEAAIYISPEILAKMQETTPDVRKSEREMRKTDEELLELSPTASRRRRHRMLFPRKLCRLQPWA